MQVSPSFRNLATDASITAPIDASLQIGNAVKEDKAGNLNTQYMCEKER